MFNDERLPNFFVIGVSKSGTTSLYKILERHPQVYLSTVKEPSFFSDDEKYAKGVEWYLETQFPKARGFPARGELTPRYLYWGSKVAARIQDACGKTPRFIAIFREPVSRAYSQYWQAMRVGIEDLSFEDALANEDKRLRDNPDRFNYHGQVGWLYYRMGLYAEQLQPYFEIFPRESFLFFLTEDLRDDFNNAVRRMFQFLQIDPSIKIPQLQSNAAAMPRSQSLNRFLRNPSPAKKRWSWLVPAPLRRVLWSSLNRANLEPFEYPPMNPETRAMLHEKYRPSIRRLESLIQRDLSHWLKE